MSKCKYHHICGLDVALNLMDEYQAEDSCILHSKNSRKLQNNKDYEEFAEALKRHRKERSQYAENFAFMFFPREADFHRNIFDKEVSFDQATFLQGANFYGARFIKKAFFGKVTFMGKTSFEGVTFAHDVNFSETRFTERTNFFMATFAKEASFSRAVFERGADFSWVTFAEGVGFSGATFLGKTLFTHKKSEVFDDYLAALQHLPGPIFSKVEADFREVNIEPPDAVTFRDADLRKCRFLDTDMRKVRLTGVQWPQIGRRLGVYDEIYASESEDAPPWERLEQLYRQLKQNYEDQHDYERAGDFHYGEKEMRRKKPETPWGLRLLLVFYWLFSGYGERMLRPILWTLGLSVVCAVAYLCDPSLKEAIPGNLTSGKNPTWGEVAIYSFQVTAFFRPQDFGLSAWAKVIYTLQSLLGPLLLGLFALAVRQKLKR